MIKLSGKITVVESSVLDPMQFGAIADGKSHPVSERWLSLEDAKAEWPHVDSLNEEIDWAAGQAAFNAARDRIQQTIGGSGNSIPRTGISYSPLVQFSVGCHIVNRPFILYPHVSIRGADWGHASIKLADSGWAQTAPRLTVNPQGVMWLGDIRASSALLWLQGDEEYPEGSGLRVAGMKNSISGLNLTCHGGPSIFISGNQNQLSIRDNSIVGWGGGPTGIGIVANNPTSSQQTTNLFLENNQIEGCRAAIVLDRVDIGSIDHNQIESCGNGIYVGSASRFDIESNKLTWAIQTKPFECGIWLGCGETVGIDRNLISGVCRNGIKLLGRHTSVSGNRIMISGGAQISESGYGIRIVGPSKQFGGNVALLKQHGVHHVHGNNIDCDVWPVAKAVPGNPNPKPLQSIWVDAAPGEKILSEVWNNVDRQW